MDALWMLIPLAVACLVADNPRLAAEGLQQMTGIFGAAAGGGGVVISAGPGGTLVDSGASPLNASCSIQYQTDFDIFNFRTQLGNQVIGLWMDPAGAEAAGDYEIRATRTAGTNPTAGDALATWLSLSSARSWTNTRTSDTPGTISSTLLIEIRRVSDSMVVSSATYNIDATVT